MSTNVRQELKHDFSQNGVFGKFPKDRRAAIVADDEILIASEREAVVSGGNSIKAELVMQGCAVDINATSLE